MSLYSSSNPLYRFLIPPIEDYIIKNVRSFLRLCCMKDISKILNKKFNNKSMLKPDDRLIATKLFLDIFNGEVYLDEMTYLHAEAWRPYRDKFYKDLERIVDDFEYDNNFIVE